MRRSLKEPKNCIRRRKVRIFVVLPVPPVYDIYITRVVLTTPNYHPSSQLCHFDSNRNSSLTFIVNPEDETPVTVTWESTRTKIWGTQKSYTYSQRNVIPTVLYVYSCSRSEMEEGEFFYLKFMSINSVTPFSDGVFSTCCNPFKTRSLQG